MAAFDPYEHRLFVEEICCELFRFGTAEDAGVLPEDVRIEREAPLGRPATFADIRVGVRGSPAFFVEVKYGYPRQTILERVGFKYGQDSEPIRGANVLYVLADAREPDDESVLERELRRRVVPGLDIRVVSVAQFAALLRERFGVPFDPLDPDTIHDLREAIFRKKWSHAFGSPEILPPGHEALRDELLWKFAFWRLRQIHESGNLDPRSILRPGIYRDVAVVIADICSFASFVRDTPDAAVIRQCLTAFYSKARYEIVNRGGMLDNFVGDMVLGLFGLPDARPGYLEDALSAAVALSAVGESVADHWQRQIDRVQPSTGVHTGVAIGDLQIVPLRPLSRTKAGIIADSVNVAARLMTAAGPGEIVMSNAFVTRLPLSARMGIEELAPLEGRNVGALKAWKLAPARLRETSG